MGHVRCKTQTCKSAVCLKQSALQICTVRTGWLVQRRQASRSYLALQLLALDRMNVARSAPAEVAAPASDDDAYLAFRAATNLREPYRIPAAYVRNIQPNVAYDMPETPLLAFINARSGGRVGPRLAVTLSRALGKSQVFDLAQLAPDKVLTLFRQNLLFQYEQGDSQAEVVRQRLRILAAGGDGTIAWILNTIRELKLDPPPPVAIIPLGTGNDLARSFGWGFEFENSWISNHDNIYHFLKRMADASATDLDGWAVKITVPSRALFKDKPHSLRESAAVVTEREVTLQGTFWNYFSVGLDAKTAFGFHRLREARPWLTSGRLVNQMWYSVMSCQSGWFCASRPLERKVSVEVQHTQGGPWQPLHIPTSVRAIVLLNLQSYAGGRMIWGRHKGDTRFKEPNCNDGLLEVVGFTNGWHTALVMGTKGQLFHGLRLAQVCGARISIRSREPHPADRPSHTYMQMDGEPWSQYIPSGDDESAVQVQVSFAGTAKVLVNHEHAPALQQVPAGVPPSSSLRLRAVPASVSSPEASYATGSVQAAHRRAEAVNGGSNALPAVAVLSEVAPGHEDITHVHQVELQGTARA